jgi:hypothetical protein
LRIVPLAAVGLGRAAYRRPEGPSETHSARVEDLRRPARGSGQGEASRPSSQGSGPNGGGPQGGRGQAEAAATGGSLLVKRKGDF